MKAAILLLLVPFFSSGAILWSRPALAAGAENFKPFEAQVSDEFKGAVPRIC